jgi:3-(3-hydroxy-phenyl)propionate hydroxylase
LRQALGRVTESRPLRKPKEEELRNANVVKFQVTPTHRDDDNGPCRFDGGVAMMAHAVLIAGAGPTGLMLAGELALAGVDVAVVERRPDQELRGARALGISSRTIEVLDQRGIADRFLSAGQVAQVTGFALTRLDISDFPTRHNYGLALRQKHIESILASWVTELKVPILYGREIMGFAQHDGAVDVALADGRSLRAQYLVGCDGGRSLVRKTAGIDFPGWDASTSNILAEVEMTETPPYGVHRTAAGTHAFGRSEYEIKGGEVIYKDVGPIGVMVTEPNANASTDPTLRELKDRLIAACGTDYGVHSPTWISRFTDMTRQAATYRSGRVFLAGDAAHVHSPIGGLGLNTGVQDAVNLGWKLAQVIKGASPDTLLDTYHAERHPVGARVLKTTMAQVALHREDDRTRALRDIVGDLLKMEEPRRRIAAEMSGLDIHYDLGNGHPLLGRRMPDLDLVTAIGRLRVFTLLHDARAVLLNVGQAGSFDVAPWADRVRVVDAKYVGAWELPVLGVVTSPTAVLVRPDGHVAWVGDTTRLGLVDALSRWFGPPATA